MKNINQDLEYDYNFALFYSKYLTGIATEMAEYYKKYLPTSNKKMKLLDIMCGTGDLLSEFEPSKFERIGIDLSEAMLNIAKSKYPNIKFIKGDIIKMDIPPSLDVVTCTADSLNHLDSIEKIDLVFKKVHDSLNTNGLFMFDMNTYYGTKLNETYVSSEDENGLVIRTGITDYQNRLGLTRFSGFFLEEGEKYIRFNSTIYNYIYKIVDIYKLIKETNFHIIKIFDADQFTEIENYNDLEKIERFERVGFILKKKEE